VRGARLRYPDRRAWSVRRARDLAERVEEEIRAAPPNASVLVHIEPLEDPASYQDQVLR
jgi:divalent metal cation (Fe/Co/Zn/Cd) transporter